jgi:hypothetical protein
MSLDCLQFIKVISASSIDFKVISAPSIDFGLLNPLAGRGLDVQGRLAPTTIEVVRAKEGVLS